MGVFDYLPIVGSNWQKGFKSMTSPDRKNNKDYQDVMRAIPGSSLVNIFNPATYKESGVVGAAANAVGGVADIGATLLGGDKGADLVDNALYGPRVSNSTGGVEVGLKTTPTPTDTTNNNVTNTGGARYGAPTVATSSPSFYTADELANRFGITYDADSILSMLNEATDAQFATQEKDLRRLRREQGIESAGIFDNLLQTTRQAEGAGVATGATLGARSANFMQQFALANEELSNVEQIYQDGLIDLATGKSEALTQNQIDAFDKSNELKQYLGTLSATIQANDIQKYIGELSANATTTAAGINANAQVGAQTARDEYLRSVLGDDLYAQYYANAASALNN